MDILKRLEEEIKADNTAGAALGHESARIHELTR